MKRIGSGRAVPLLLSVALFATMGWALWTTNDLRRTMPQVRVQAMAVQELVGEVARLDEALTGTVRLAVTTGDRRWRERYTALEAEITAAIDALNAVAEPMRQNRRSTPAIVPGPGTLAALEDSAFRLVDADSATAALALLDSDLYAAAKTAYGARKARLLQEAEQVVAAAEARTDRQLTRLILAAVISVLLLLGIWTAILGARGERAQRRLQAELRRSEERLRVIVDAAPVAIVRVNRRTEVQFWNAAAERIFGWTAEEVLGRPYPAAGLKESEEAQDLFAQGFGGTVLEGVEIRRRRKDGSEVDLRVWNALVRDEAGEVVALVGILADVTEQRTLEERLRQTQKLEAVGKLAGGIAHDFNNVLTAVRGHAELLLERLPEDDQTTQDIEEIRRNADRATQLTRQLLAFSRQQVLKPRVLDLGAVVRGMERMLHRLIGEHIRLEVHVAADTGRVEADPTQLEQVLLNLAVNARDAMPEGGTLFLRLGNTVLTEEDARAFPYQVRPGRYVRLLVADTGQGMDDDTRGRVFEPFFTTKGLSNGTGLGLATVFGIVKQSGGYIWVRSRPGDGAEFEILLPRVEKALPKPAPESPAATGGSGGTETVLLVEDDHAVRALARRVLEKQGYRVLEACHPADALLNVIPAHEGGEIDLLVTDVVMPEMDGRALAERVRELYPDIRTIFMSGYTEDEVLRLGISTGSTRFLQKPFGPPDLAWSVRQTLDAG